MSKKIACLQLLFLFSTLFLWSSINAQTKTIIGKVTRSDNGLPLSGVSIAVKGKTTGTQTASDGTYAIVATPADELVFTYLGFIEVSKAVGNNSTLNVSMGLADSK